MRILKLVENSDWEATITSQQEQKKNPNGSKTKICAHGCAETLDSILNTGLFLFTHLLHHIICISI